MSRLKPQKEYEKTGAFHFFRWLSGSKDPYLGEVEMKPQKEVEITEATIIERMNEKQMIRDKVYAVKRNRQLLLFGQDLCGFCYFVLCYFSRTFAVYSILSS